QWFSIAVSPGPVDVNALVCIVYLCSPTVVYIKLYTLHINRPVRIVLKGYKGIISSVTIGSNYVRQLIVDAYVLTYLVTLRTFNSIVVNSSNLVAAGSGNSVSVYIKGIRC